MKSLVQILTEKYSPKLGKIGYLNKVKYIRHYTTAEGLAGMLYDGYIAPNMSEGDADWHRYEMYGKEVVSFHDARYDPEWNNINDANFEGSELSTTKTLGLHIGDICACIEYDFTNLPADIQQHCGLIDILKTYVEDFYKAWNQCIELASIVNKPEDILEFEPNVKSYISSNEKQKEKQLNEEFAFLKKLKGIKFSEKDCDDLFRFAASRQTSLLISKLLKIGWDKGDEKSKLYQYYIELYKALGEESLGSDIKSDFLSYIAKHIAKSINDKINIEIRFDTKIPLQYAKRIIVFDGIVNHILSWGFSADVDDIEDMNIAIEAFKNKYVIERIPKGEIAKKLR